jgi:hypothetical protein
VWSNQLTRHNRLQGRFVALAREQGCATEQNPRLSIEDAKNQQEPDVVFYFGFGRPVEADITVVNPTAPSYVCRSVHPVVAQPWQQRRGGRKTSTNTPRTVVAATSPHLRLKRRDE